MLAVQGTLKSLLQHHSSKASILQHSAFFIVQLSHPYMTTGKTIALTRAVVYASYFGDVSALGRSLDLVLNNLLGFWKALSWIHVCLLKTTNSESS